MSGRPHPIEAGLGALDARLGDALEAAVRTHHRRRLERQGWGQALDPAPGGWAQGGVPARAGCELELLIDGAATFAAMVEAIRGAQDSVWLSAWYVNAGFELLRGEDAVSLGALLAEAADRVDVRVLLWAGSPIRLFQPNRQQAEQTAADLVRASRVRCVLDASAHALHCNHEKTLIVDGQVAVIGGIDATDLKNERFDTPGHPARDRIGWHDIACSLRGPVVADVADHFALRWEAVTREPLPRPAVPAPAGPHTVQMTRTVPEGIYPELARGDFTILASYLSALRDAEELVYIENQFLWAPEITDVLADKLADPPSDAFRVVILLPTKPHAGNDDTMGQIGLLEDADRHDRLSVVTLRSVSDGRVDELYIHAKLAIVDDRWLTVGSANLNAHSLLNDSELNVVCDDPDLARDTRLTLWAEHLDCDRAELADRRPEDLVDTMWRPIAAEQLRRERAGLAPTHRLRAMSGVSRRSRRLLGPLNGLLEDA